MSKIDEINSEHFDNTEKNQLEATNTKHKKWKIRLISLLIVLIPSFLYSWSEFKKDYQEYLILKDRGIVVDAISEFRPSWDVDYYYYYFITDKGEKIEKQGKLADESKFNDYYNDLKVIYDPRNPHSFMEYPYYLKYPLGYKIVFYLVFMTLFFAIMGAGILSSIYVVLKTRMK